MNRISLPVTSYRPVTVIDWIGALRPPVRESGVVSERLNRTAARNLLPARNESTMRSNSTT